jgi:hypothetical protein
MIAILHETRFVLRAENAVLVFMPHKPRSLVRASL